MFYEQQTYSVFKTNRLTANTFFTTLFATRRKPLAKAPTQPQEAGDND
jgi:hypothetical protein